MSLRGRRLLSGLSQSLLADVFGVHQTTISRIEQGGDNLTAREREIAEQLALILPPLSDALDVSEADRHAMVEILRSRIQTVQHLREGAKAA